MSCTSCHDPHRVIASTERVSWYRAKCLACHTGPKFATQHHSDQPDCTACHMPQANTTDIAHEQSTDHRIPRLLDEIIDVDEPSSKLIPIVGSKPGAREYGLAYLTFAQKGDLFSKSEALHFLKAASLAEPADASVSFALGQLTQSQGEQAKAAMYFRETYRLEPRYPGAASAFGDSLEAVEALAVWKQAYALNPPESGLGLRLALAQCEGGDLLSAKHTLDVVTRFDPDFQAAQQTRRELSRTDQPSCQAHKTN